MHQGKQQEAIERVKKALERPEAFLDKKLLLTALFNFYRQIGDAKQMPHYAVLGMIHNPLNYQARIQLLESLHAMQDKEAETQQIDAFFNDFVHAPLALLALNDFAIISHNVPVAEQIYSEALNRGWRIHFFALSRLQTFLVSQDYTAADHFIKTLLKEAHDWIKTPLIETLLNALRMALYYGQGQKDLAEAYFKRLRQEQLPLDKWLSVVQLLYKKGSESRHGACSSMSMSTPRKNKR